MIARHFVVTSYNKIKSGGDSALHDGNHHNFDFTLPLGDVKNEDDMFVSVTRCSIPKTWYLINSPNNTFTLAESGHANVTVTIPVGNYNTITILAAQLSTLLTAASPSATTYTVSPPKYGDSTFTGKMTFTCAPAINVSLIMPSGLYEGVWDCLGFLAGSTNAFVGGSLTSTQVCSIVPEDVIVINSDICKDPNRFLVFINAATTPFGASVTYENPDIIANAKPFAGRATSYSFSIRDVHGHDLDTNGRPISFTLCVFRNPTMITMRALQALGPKLETFLDKSNIASAISAITATSDNNVTYGPMNSKQTWPVTIPEAFGQPLQQPPSVLQSPEPSPPEKKDTDKKDKK